MPGQSPADTIRILVATDSHVGYNERDPIRGNDSWRSFEEVMSLAKQQDVDMVLLAGDLFHENKPSRQSMFHVMRSLRENCFGDKPCELELLSDATENFGGAFDCVNYEDPNLNVAIPVFSIHGNHDDPSGEGHYAALDLLQVSGLVNYYGKTPESDNVVIKPVLLQKGHTKLALYGMSNVRDERLFRTFRDGNVKFFQPSQQKNDWFNIMSVHQNHHAYTETGYLPENFLPQFLDLVIWGHEHECLIDPRYNPEMTFHVMQPGSSVATSLMPGEAVPKQVAILNVTGKDFTVEPIKLKSVRPFFMREIVLAEEKEMKNVWKNDNCRPIITRFLMGIVEDLIAQARDQWLADHDVDADDVDEEEIPKPLIRLRVEFTAPEGGRFDCENPQRFSNRFVGKVANVQDVVQFYRKKATAKRKLKADLELPDQSVINQLAIDNIKVEKLVREYLTAQTLTILPQNSFGDAVGQFIDKDDKNAMEAFVNDSLADQMKHLLSNADVDEDDMAEAMDKYRSKLEELFAAGHIKTKTTRKLKPRPDTWDSDMDGEWADQPGAIVRDDDEDEEDGDGDLGSVPPKPPTGRGRGRGRGRGGAAGTTRKTATAAKKTPAAKGGRGKKKAVEEDDDQEDDDVIMIDDDEEESDEETLFVKPAPKAAKKSAAKKPAAKRAASPAKRAPTRAAASRQTTLSFSQPPSQPSQPSRRAGRTAEPSEDEISDDDDAFEPPAPTSRSTRAKR